MESGLPVDLVLRPGTWGADGNTFQTDCTLISATPQNYPSDEVVGAKIFTWTHNSGHYPSTWILYRLHVELTQVGPTERATGVVAGVRRQLSRFHVKTRKNPVSETSCLYRRHDDGYCPEL
jgi:hypothetical protein